MVELNGTYQKGSKYLIEKKIGAGGNSNVYQGKWHQPNGDVQDVAIKFIEKITNSGRKNAYYEKEFQITKIIVEAQLKQKSAQKKIIGVIEIYDIIEQPSITYIVSELSDHGDLYFQVLKNYIPLDFQMVLRIGYNMIKGLEFLHTLSIAHRDLKPENFIIFEGNNQSWEVKIIDFGVSSQKYEMESKVGTVYYLAQELINSQQYTNKIDIWSYGCILHELITGEPLFSGASQGTIIQKIRNFKGNYIYPDRKEFKRLYEVIENCISVNPSKRKTASEISKTFEQIAQQENIYLLFQNSHSNTKQTQQSLQQPQQDLEAQNILQNQTASILDFIKQQQQQQQSQLQQHQQQLQYQQEQQQYQQLQQQQQQQLQQQQNTNQNNVLKQVPDFFPQQQNEAIQYQDGTQSFPSNKQQNNVNFPFNDTTLNIPPQNNIKEINIEDENDENQRLLSGKSLQPPLQLKQREQCLGEVIQHRFSPQFINTFSDLQKSFQEKCSLPAYRNDFQSALDNHYIETGIVRIICLLFLICKGDIDSLNQFLEAVQLKLQENEQIAIYHLLFEVISDEDVKDESIAKHIIRLIQIKPIQEAVISISQKPMFSLIPFKSESVLKILAKEFPSKGEYLYQSFLLCQFPNHEVVWKVQQKARAIFEQNEISYS